MNSFIPVPVSYMATPATQQEILFAPQKTESAPGPSTTYTKSSPAVAVQWIPGKQEGGFWRLQCRSLVSVKPDSVLILG